MAKYLFQVKANSARRFIKNRFIVARGMQTARRHHCNIVLSGCTQVECFHIFLNFEPFFDTVKGRGTTAFGDCERRAGIENTSINFLYNFLRENGCHPTNFRFEFRASLLQFLSSSNFNGVNLNSFLSTERKK